jgi:hypothetical protein
MVAAIVMATFSVLPGSACEPASFPRSFFDEPLEQNADGSFDGLNLRAARKLGNYDAYWGGFILGGRAIDIGDGRVGQKITKINGCRRTEYLLFVECLTGSGITIMGEYQSGSGGGDVEMLSISTMQSPYGPIALRAATTVDEVDAVAKANDYKYTRDVMADVNKMIRPQRYDPFIGCKIFYPESPGAKM